MAEQTCPCCGSDLRISCNTAHPEHDCYHPDGPERPQPDWADLREMARNAGWAGHADEPHVRIWGANGTDRMNLDWDAGSVRVFRHGLVVDLAGPSATYTHESVHLINPTPARVLAAARLVGLGGAS